MNKYDCKKILYQYLERKNNSTRRNHIVGIYNASEIPYCLRKSYYIYTQPKPVLPSETLRKFEVGNIFHEYFEKILSQTDLYLSSEQLVQKKLGEKIVLQGHYDVMITEGEEKGIIEFKTVKNLYYIPYDHHIDQTQLYLFLTGCTFAYLTYMEKENCQLYTESIKFGRDEAKIKELIKRVKRLHKALVKKDIPERIATFQCDFCEFEQECFSGEGADS